MYPIVSAQPRKVNLQGLGSCAQPNDPPPMTITPVQGLRGLGECNGIILPPQYAAQGMGDIFTDAADYIKKAGDVVGGAASEASETLGRAIGNSLGQIVETAVEKNPTTAKTVVATGAVLGVGMVLTAFGIGYLIGNS